MREKRVHRRRRAARSDRSGPDVAEVADWFLVNETQWGLPHGNLVLIAGLIVGARAAVSGIERVAFAVDRALTRRWG